MPASPRAHDREGKASNKLRILRDQAPPGMGAASLPSRGCDIRREADVIMGVGRAKTLTLGADYAKRGVGKRDAG
jgi:hypothetical protein